ncbi:uncharacterized protein BO80DRAFT_500498 [Aspergillus ibericus CBS 121593]|uniref:Altered inheritance of mitochondria protein 6 n=1 Tax=Aspergillus ibericus CBS 121593 TaxID=1448316 RepID=A0A395H6E1_9EURO|nr:hypothetical protein BO80DRAFT_500498 [Aspergillus ibericus CBS 121593]RAL03186.1 hypothetical protein BO80DRAFT_500498 [Aspergillus ibericus CBS 121593]
MVPEEGSDHDESSFEVLRLSNFSARRRRKKVATRVPHSRLRNLCGFWKCRHLYCHNHPYSRRAMICRLVKRPFWGVVIILGFLKLVSLIWSGLIYLFPDDLDARLDAWSTHGVLPVRCHSHNDYWRDVPLHSALSAGCIGVEADIWLSNYDLLVGHTPFTLHHEVTLRSLYLNPLLDLLQKHNTRSSQLEPTHQPGRPRAGVFASDPSQTLVLLIDFKEQPEKTWSVVMDQLKPLRDGDYFTYFNGWTSFPAPSPSSRPAMLPSTASRRTKPTATSSTMHLWTNSPYYPSAAVTQTPKPNPSTPTKIVTMRRSTSESPSGQLELVRKQIEAAHMRGLKVRYWGTPSWPRGLRNHVWHVLVREGVDLINVDDLREATRQDWRKHRSWFF